MSGSETFKNFSAYFRRSLRFAKDRCLDSVRMDVSWKKEMPMFKLNSVDSLQQWTVGSDSDIGGSSEAFWGLTPQRTGILWGSISTEIAPHSNLNISGYAGIRSKERPVTLLHRPRFDVSEFRYLAVRVKGDTRQWFVNIQSDTIFPSYLWQHRLYLRNPGEWETVLIPFRDFILTAHGFVQRKQWDLDKAKIKSIGFSVVRQPGDFSLELDWIKAVNTPQTFGEIDISPEPVKSNSLDLSEIKLLPDKNDRSWF